MSGRRPRVLLVTGSLPPMRCGVGEYVAGLARALSATGGAEVGVLTSRFAGRDGTAPPAGFALLEPIADWHLGSLRPALAAVRAWRPDVVHVQHPSLGYDGQLPFVLGVAARWRLGVPVVATLHEPLHVNIQLPFANALIRSADAIVVVRHNFLQRNKWKVRWSFAGVPLRFIPNATTLPRVERTPELVRAVRERYRTGAKPLVAYFGFLYPVRGVHELFSIADPARHHLVIVGGRLDHRAEYQEKIQQMAAEGAWRGACTLTGFLPEREAAEVLAAADAIVLPFTKGGGSWNTSLHGARLQGTVVITTSLETRGYDGGQNVYYAAPGDVAEMRAALDRHIGTHRPPSDVPTWERVAAGHLDVYAAALAARAR